MSETTKARNERWLGMSKAALIMELQDLHARQAEPVSQWISVDDRLPETTDDVLVCDGKLVMIAEYWKATENEIADGWCDSYNGEEVEQITHWMPLPKPPAREGK